MPAFAVSDHLNLVDRQKIDHPVDRHRFHRAEEVLCPGRNDLFLACNQRHQVSALLGDHALIIFTGQQAQRKTNHAGAVTEHSFDRQMRLTRVGRPKHDGDARGLTMVHCHSLSDSYTKRKSQRACVSALSCTYQHLIA